MSAHTGRTRGTLSAGPRPGGTIPCVGYRIIVVTAIGRKLACGGRFAALDDAASWGQEMRQYGAIPGEIVDYVPPDIEAMGKRAAWDQIRADQRQALTEGHADVDGDPDELLTLDQLAAHWNISRESVEQDVAHGRKPRPDQRSDSIRGGLWRRATITAWDRDAVLRRSRPRT